jgi:hypothetical protein
MQHKEEEEEEKKKEERTHLTKSFHETYCNEPSCASLNGCQWGK